MQTRIQDLLKKTANLELIELLDAELVELKMEKIKYDNLIKDILPMMLETSNTPEEIEKIEEDWTSEKEKVRIAVTSLTAKIIAVRRNFASGNNCESILNQTMRETGESSYSIRLPKIEVPTFAGDLRDWNDFQNLFKNLVHENPNLSNVQKLYYLKNAIKGTASDLIRDYFITDANYIEAWNTLTTRYDNKRATIKVHLRDLFNLQKIKNEKEIRKLLDNSAKSVRSLKALGENTDG